MQDSEILQAKVAAWILGGVADREKESRWFRFPNPSQEIDDAEERTEGP